MSRDHGIFADAAIGVAMAAAFIPSEQKLRDIRRAAAKPKPKPKRPFKGSKAARKRARKPKP